MNHLSVAIADDNQKILDLLEKVIGTDQELDLVGKAKNGWGRCVGSLKKKILMWFFST